MPRMNAAVATRSTAAERREEILRVAVIEFGRTGLHGTSTETIAREVGVSQPYIFRLFGTKKQLFMESVRWGFDHTVETFREAGANSPDGHTALRRMGQAYEQLVVDPRFLGIQLQGYASTDDPEIQAVVEDGFGRLVQEIVRHTGIDAEQLAAFLGRGMLMNVASSMGVLDSDEGWARMIRDGCIGGFETD